VDSADWSSVVRNSSRALDEDLAHEENEWSYRTALRPSHFLRLRLIRALVSDPHAVWGDGRVDKAAHVIAHTGLKVLNVARNDRKDRGRVVWIERPERVVRGRDEHPEIESKSESKQTGEQKISHVRSLLYCAAMSATLTAIV
jgi:hypothetical protein